MLQTDSKLYALLSALDSARIRADYQARCERASLTQQTLAALLQSPDAAVLPAAMRASLHTQV